VRQSLMNLVGNAIKFTERGWVRLEVRYEAARERAQIDVVDSGIGISPERMGQLFQPFEQADTSVTRRFGGTGLGLAITQRIARLLGGDCTAQSVPSGGSRFSFALAAPLAPGAQLIEPGGVPAPAGPGPRAGRRQLRLDARVLLAEDGPDNRQLIGLILRRAGARVEMVENGALAVERMRREAFDVVLMDVAMPVMDGYTATRTLREMGVDVPILALTAHALSGERERCLEAGCDEYLTKPIDRVLLIEQIQQLLERKRQSSSSRAAT
jgi:CheY-like chemotaxis protein